MNWIWKKYYQIKTSKTWIFKHISIHGHDVTYDINYVQKISTSKSMVNRISHHSSNLSLIARETMRLLVNHQLISIAIQPKSISIEQTCYKRSQGIAITSLHCLLFLTSKNKHQKRISKSAANVVSVLKFLWTSKLVFPK